MNIRLKRQGCRSSEQEEEIDENDLPGVEKEAKKKKSGADVKTENKIKNKIKSEIKSEIKSKVKNKVKREIKSEIKSENMNKIKCRGYMGNGVFAAISGILEIEKEQINKSRRRDYSVYQWKRGELITEVMKGVGITLILSYFFYRSILAAIPLSAIGLLYVKKRKDEKAQTVRRMLNIQFKECILSVSASLRAGYAIENAFIESKQDMELLYGDASYIYEELDGMRRGLVMNVTLENLLRDFGARSGCEPIREFTEVFSIAKRSGGNLAHIIQSCTEVIGQRIEAEDEMVIMISSRRMEQRIMNVMPFGILLYVELSNQGYFDGLYHNLFGIGMMSICLLVYLAAFGIAQYILSQATAFE